MEACSGTDPLIMGSEGLSMRNWSSRVRLASCAACAVLALAAGNAAADEISTGSVLSDAVGAANRIDDGRAKAQTLSSIATAQAQIGDIAGATETVDAIPVNRSGDSSIADCEAGWKDDAYATIAGCQAAKGNIASASATAKSINQPDMCGMAYQYISQALARRGDIAGAKAIADHLHGIFHDRANAAIAEAAAAGGDVSGAKQIAGGLDDACEKVKAFALIAETQIKAGDVAGARQTLELAKTAADDVPEWVARVPYGTLAAALVKAGDLDGAYVMRKADASYINREIAIAQAQMKDFTAAKASLAQITTPCDIACANASVAEAEIRAGDASEVDSTLDCAKAALSSITESTELAEACARIAQAQARAGDAATAADWARSQQDPEVEVSALIGVACGMNASTEVNTICANQYSP
jgi:hypothetical protein